MQDLTCQLTYTVYPSPPDLPSLLDLEGVLGAQLHHYQDCPARQVRDCVVLAYSRRALQLYRRAVVGGGQA